MRILLSIIYAGALSRARQIPEYEPEIQHVLRLLTQTLKAYLYRRIPHSNEIGPGFILLRDGHQIPFGGGPESGRLGGGPNPRLCELQLAVARVFKMSGAAELITQIAEDADDSDFPHAYVASQAFCDILDAKLLASGRALLC